MKTTTKGHTVAEWEKAAAENNNIVELDEMILNKGAVRAVFGIVRYKGATARAAWRADGRCYVQSASHKPGNIDFCNYDN